MQPSSSFDHRPQLDSLRCLAFLMVFFFHVNEKRFVYGFLGVPLFFVLSGFLITRILLLGQTDSLKHDLKVFYLRRTLRIFPLYYAVLIVLLVSGQLVEPSPPWYFLYLHNVYIFLTDGWTGRTNHFWSLCVEEQFYILYPLLLLLTPARWRLLFLGVLLAGSIATRITLHQLYPQSRAWALLPVAGEYLLWGSLAGLLELKHPHLSVPAWVLLLGGIILHGWAAVDASLHGMLAVPETGSVYQTVHALGFTLIVFACWRLPPGLLLRLLTLAPIVYLGRISYGLYLFHNFSYGIKAALPWSVPVPGALVALAATVSLAALSWHFFEQPINRLKRHFPYRPVETSQQTART